MVLLFLLPCLVAGQFFYPATDSPSTASIVCNKYQCDPNPSRTSVLFSYCITYNKANSTFLVNPCNHSDIYGNYCEPTDVPANTPVQCSVPQTEWTNLYPGEYPCSSNSSCISNYCNNEICVGSAYGESCQHNEDCEPGLGCNLGTCMQLLRPGESGCKNDTDCVTTCGCDYNPASGTPGVCKPYFSIPVAQPLQACENSISLLCTTAQCNTTSNGKSQCIPGIVSNNALPHMCVSDADCWGTSNGNIANTMCSCGYNNQGQGYCVPFPGDKPGVNLLNQLKKWQESLLVVACNTEARWSFSCMKNVNYKLYDAVKYWYYAYAMHPYLQNNDQCVQNVYTSLYWDAKSDYQMDNGAISFILPALVVALAFN